MLCSPKKQLSMRWSFSKKKRKENKSISLSTLVTTPLWFPSLLQKITFQAHKIGITTICHHDIHGPEAGASRASSEKKWKGTVPFSSRHRLECIFSHSQNPTDSTHKSTYSIHLYFYVFDSDHVSDWTSAELRPSPIGICQLGRNRLCLFIPPIYKILMEYVVVFDWVTPW